MLDVQCSVCKLCMVIPCQQLLLHAARAVAVLNYYASGFSSKLLSNANK